MPSILKAARGRTWPAFCVGALNTCTREGAGVPEAHKHGEAEGLSVSSALNAVSKCSAQCVAPVSAVSKCSAQCVAPASLACVSIKETLLGMEHTREKVGSYSCMSTLSKESRCTITVAIACCICLSENRRSYAGSEDGHPTPMMEKRTD
eukprot:1159919-Pelagomonas_calceolata.AAC.3